MKACSSASPTSRTSRCSAIASARPSPELVVLMEKIGKILVSRPEQIVIRGHTDGRPYRAGDYDNWRLSTARAQMAYYMLVRSGIPEGRVDRIEGHADHNLKLGDSPLAAENRRIEILLAKGKS
ncbi:MAG: OmpA family protein [Hyphomicrobium sp.]